MTKHKVEEITLTGQGKSIEQAFSNTALNMFSIVTDPSKVSPAQRKSIMLRSKDLKNLLYLFLKKLYDLASNDLFLLNEVKDVVIEDINNEYLLTAVAYGDKLSNHEIKDIVKQCTDRNISIKEDKDGCKIQINLVVERRILDKEEDEV